MSVALILCQLQHQRYQVGLGVAMCTHSILWHCCKCFTYVTKTHANLTTYSRKPENYNGTIIFEIDIMKNLSPINLNLGHT